jgi:hypothetical protein
MWRFTITSIDPYELQFNDDKKSDHTDMINQFYTRWSSESYMIEGVFAQCS